MKFDKFFEICKEKGITASQIQASKSSAISIKLYHHEIDTYRISSSQSVVACGIYKGKFGSARTNKLDKTTFEYLANQIILSATYCEKEEEASLFEGSKKYVKHNTYNKELPAIPLETKIKMLRELENDIYAADPRVTEADSVAYSEAESESLFYNSFGLKLKQKNNSYCFSAGVVAKDKEETKTFYDSFLEADFSKFDEKKFVKSLVDRTLSKFGGAPCKAGKYPTVLHRDIIASLIGYFLASCSADEVQRHSSFLEGKVGQKIASSKVTIAEKPLTKNLYFTSFDDEGVATSNKVIVKKGVLQGFFYNRETAKKEGKETTGNGYWEGSKIGVGCMNVEVKPGKRSFAEMISPIKEGVYITEIAGLDTGMNSNSGDFSCQAEGYKIRNGEIAEPLNLITLSGNLLKMLQDVKEFDKETILVDDMSVSNVYIRRMSIGGK